MTGEIQKKKPKRSFGQNLVAFFNTGLGLWLLSSIVLSGVTFGYSEFNRSRLASRQQAEDRQRLETEIDLRFAVFRRLIDAKSDFSGGDDTEMRLKAISRYREKVRAAAIFVPPEPEQVLQPQYAKRNVLSLLAEYLPLEASFERLRVEAIILTLAEASRMRIEASAFDQENYSESQKAQLEDARQEKFHKLLSDAAQSWNDRATSK